MVKNKIKINIFLKLLLKRLPRRRVQALDSRENTDSPMGFFFFFFLVDNLRVFHSNVQDQKTRDLSVHSGMERGNQECYTCWGCLGS